MFSLPTLISFAIAALFLAFLATRLEVDLAGTWSRITRSDPRLYLLAFVVYYASFPVRGLRWRIIARNAHLGEVGRAPVPSAVGCARLILLGWFVNTISWFRLGDAYRGYAFSEDTGASFSRTMGTVVAERLIDTVAVFTLLLLGTGLLVATGSLRPSLLFLGAAFGLVVGGVVLLPVMKHLGFPAARLLPQRITEAYHRLYEGTMGSFKKLPLLGGLSLTAWVLEAGRLFLVLHALGLSVSFVLVLFVAVAAALLTIIPVTPGGLGIVEPGIVGLLMLELPRDAAVSAALADRSISYLSVVAVGGALFLVRQVQRHRAAGRSAAVRDT